ncbi:MAG: GNAT family N-acetyltransferase [Solobacterium sp.]|nr:GNAT family N-acetyltransferase [Solobacterium sp.]
MLLSWLFSKNRITGDVVDLVEEQKTDGRFSADGVTNIMYGIYEHGKDVKVGNCDLRVGMNRELYYAGNIGYNVIPAYRGHGYAYQACLLLFDIARDEYGMNELIITCSPENTPSRRTLEKLNGELLETADVPEDHWLYKRGEPVKNIYRYSI